MGEQTMNEIDKIFYNLEKWFFNNLQALIGTNGNLGTLFNLNSLSDAKIEEKNNKVNVNLEIPNVSKDHQLRLSVERDHLIVQGELNKQKKMKSDKGHQMSQHYSEYFYKVIPLSSKVTSKGATAVYDKGILKVALNKIGKLDNGNIRIDYK